MKTFLFLSALALVGLQGCSKSEDSNQDANGACKQEYLDAWNAVGNASYSSNKTSACQNLKNKGAVSCKANVVVLRGSAQSGERNISYDDFKTECDSLLSSNSSSPSSPSNSYSTPAPTSKYSKLSGGRCNNSFLNLYNSLNQKSKLFEIAEKYQQSTEAAKLAAELVSLCAEKVVAEVESPSCLASKNDPYSYSYSSSVTAYLSEFNSACAGAQQSLDVAAEQIIARSTRVLSKVEKYTGTVESYSAIKKFNSVGGATYLFEGVWLKEGSMKTKMISLAEDRAVCNISTKAVIIDGSEFMGAEIKTSKEPVVNEATQETVELYKTEFVLTDKNTESSTVKVRCLKKTEVTIDDLETFLNKSLTLKVIKAKK
ncbi:MAG: hypothetical protein JNM24_02680 [Bdellovibrionaceae bacterium]|nr:hypothetical protein [Pseudobdellovibrionaceae bacterium]